MHSFLLEEHTYKYYFFRGAHEHTWLHDKHHVSKSKRPTSTLLTDIFFLRAGAKRTREEVRVVAGAQDAIGQSLAATKILF